MIPKLLNLIKPELIPFKYILHIYSVGKKSVFRVYLQDIRMNIHHGMRYKYTIHASFYTPLYEFNGIV